MAARDELVAAIAERARKSAICAGLFNALYLPKEVTEMQHTAAIVHPAAR